MKLYCDQLDYVTYLPLDRPVRNYAPEYQEHQAAPAGPVPMYERAFDPTVKARFEGGNVSFRDATPEEVAEADRKLREARKRAERFAEISGTGIQFKDVR